MPARIRTNSSAGSRTETVSGAGAGTGGARVGSVQAADAAVAEANKRTRKLKNFTRGVNKIKKAKKNSGRNIVAMAPLARFVRRVVEENRTDGRAARMSPGYLELVRAYVEKETETMVSWGKHIANVSGKKTVKPKFIEAVVYMDPSARPPIYRVEDDQ